jgi:ribosomal-protein-serine acetyltransferase
MQVMQFPLQVQEGVILRPLAISDAPDFLALIQQDQANFNRWLRWTASIQTLADAEAYIDKASVQRGPDEGFHAGMWVDGRLAGGIACFPLNRRSHKTEIGYWLGAEFRGRGLVTTACRLVIDHLIRVESMHRIEIQAVTENIASRAVAERLGFTLEGVLRDSEWITDSYRDHALYSLLEGEWR